MNIILFDHPEVRSNLLPFTFTRPVADIRIGILTIIEKWRKLTGGQVSFLAHDYLQKKYPPLFDHDNYLINGGICPDPTFFDSVMKLRTGQALVHENKILAVRTGENNIPELHRVKQVPYPDALLIDRPWKIFQRNGEQIRSDFKLITRGRKSCGLNDIHTRVYGEENIFVEEGAKVLASVLNADSGPIYLGKNSFIQEGALIRGPFSLGEESQVNIGAKVRGDTTVGPGSKIGGELNNCVFFGYSNKVHDGYLGNSVVGEWCNLGADTNTSNMKNTFGNIKQWNYTKRDFIDTELMFCGLMMGDHSKCAINTMFNSGTVVGVSANIFGAGFPPTFIPSFSWGGTAGFHTFEIGKAIQTATIALGRKNIPLTEMDKEILIMVFNQSAAFRTWEKKN